jgi:ABC-2 type transport system ATP-binding protein
MNELILRTTNLGKLYKKRWAVKNLNLEIFRGDVFGFLGPNGAGKSTTIRMLLSLIKPTTGEVFLFGHSVLREREKALQKVGGIVEKPDFYLYLNAVRNLEIVGALNGGATRKRIFEVLDLVGLASRAKDKVKTFSHGMKQRLGIASSLLSDPELIVLDEPTSGLDPQGMKEVRELILHLSRDQNKTILISSHLLHEIELVANRTAIINKGELMVQGEVSKLLDEGEKFVVFDATPEKKFIAVAKRATKLVKSVAKREKELRATMEFTNVPAFVELLVKNGVRIHSIHPRRSLEELFLSITESAERT